MSLHAHEITKVIVNSLPIIYSGPKVQYKWSTGIEFFSDPPHLLFCANPALLVVNSETKEIIAEFRTQTSVRFTKPENNYEAEKLAFGFFKTAADGFNWYMNDKCKNLAFYILYPDVKIEQVVERIRTAYLDIHPYNPIMNN
jgi:hypothetical protein